MHIIQQQLLRLAQEKNLGQCTLREIGGFIGVDSPQRVKHHLLQLEKKGLLVINKSKGAVTKVQQGWNANARGSRILSIPILGAVNAGPATIYADANVEGFLKVSERLLKHAVSPGKKLFALKVSGPSMNRAQLDGNYIGDGDHVIIDTTRTNPSNNDIVLSVIDGMANIKRYFKDRKSGQIALLSESTQEFPPIYIHEDDNAVIGGTVIQVIKKPKRGT